MINEAEFIAELQQRRSQKYPAKPDIQSALTDYFRLHRQKIDNPEPLARQWQRDRLSLAGIHDATRAFIPSSEFGQALESSLTQLIRQSFSDAAADVAIVTRSTPVQNFLETTLPSLSFGPPGEMADDSEIPKLPFEISESATGSKLREFGVTVGFSKAVVSAYSDEISDSLQNYSRVFSLLELRLLAELLESATLPTLGSSALAAAGLSAAAGSLRKQLNAAGQLSNHALNALLVPAELEGTARQVREAAGWSELRIVVNPFLTSATTWYAVARSENSPILRLHLRDSGLPSLFLNTRKSQDAGLEFAMTHSVNFAVAGANNGILQVTA